MSVVDDVTTIDFDKDQYIDQILTKQQIYIHHTASSGNPFGVAEYWESNAERVGTSFLIARGTGKKYKDGQIFQCFPSNRAAWHLGLKQRDLDRGKPGNKTSTSLNLNAIGIEICNWGNVVYKNGKYLTYEESAVPADQIHEYPNKFRDYQFYQSYTDAQLESVRALLRYLCDRYEIASAYKGDEIFDIDKRALRGENGIFTHVSVRTDKKDCHPQPELIQMLKSL